MRVLLSLFLASAVTVAVAAQQGPPPGGRQGGPAPGGRQGGGPALSPSASAPVDLTGYWVSVVTEDWRFRMVTPPKGDYASVQLTPEARKIADSWDPSTDGSCLAYGAAGLMRMPARFHVTWQDPSTLKIESDAGQQTRLLRFDATAPEGGERTLQGFSIARWDVPAVGRGGRGGRGGVAPGGPRWAPLRVVTTNLTSAWLRKNGVPYSEDAVVTETFIRFSDGADEWMTITTSVEDPRYLNQAFLTSSNFKREPDGSKFKPTPCRSAP
jgi:hypothetical protein